MIQHSKDAGTTVTILFIDLDDFKPINDRHGHQVGDMVLRVVSQRIRSCVRGADPVVRLGGDEFVVAVEVEQRSLFSVERLRQSLSDAIACPIGLDRSAMFVTASIGIAIYPFDAADATELINIADTRMYEAKRRAKPASPSAPPPAVLPNLGNVVAAPDSTMNQSW